MSMRFRFFDFGHRRIRLSQLKAEAAALLARKEELTAFECPRLLNERTRVFGDRNLRLFVLALRQSEKSADADALSDMREQFSRRVEEYLSLPFDSGIDASLQKELTDLLRRGFLHVHPIVTGSDRALVQFATLIDAYRRADADSLRELVANYEADSAPEVDDSSAADRLIRAIECLHVQIEELELSFPYRMAYDLADPEWVEKEKKRLDAEIERLSRILGAGPPHS